MLGHLGSDALVVEETASEAAPDADGFRYVSDSGQPYVFDTFETNEPLGEGEYSIPLESLVSPTAQGVAVRLEAAARGGDWATLNGYVAVNRCGTPPAAADVDLWEDELSENVGYALLDPAHTLCIYVYSPHHQVDVAVQLLGYFTDTQASGGEHAPTLVYNSETYPGLTPITPTRALDTRIGLGAPAALVPPDGTVALDLSGHVGFGTEAVVLNLTSTEAPAPGFVTAYSCDEVRPDASNVNYVAGQSVANLVVAPLSFDGFVCLYSYAGGHLVADLAGTYDWGGGDLFSAVAPTRILDTRSGLGAPAGRLGAGQVLDLTVAGRGGVPTGASAVTFSLTATETGGPGFLTAYPCDQPRPTASNVNYLAGQNVPNQVTVKLAGNGHVCLFSHADSHVLVDVAGYFSANGERAGFISISPQRLFDTRGTPPVAPDEELVVSVGEVDASVGAAVINLTATEPSAAGFLTAYPCDETPPNSSNVNYTTGQNLASLATVKLDMVKQFCVSTYASSHVVVDLAGLFTTDRLWFTDFRVYG